MGILPLMKESCLLTHVPTRLLSPGRVPFSTYSKVPHEPCYHGMNVSPPQDLPTSELERIPFICLSHCCSGIFYCCCLDPSLMNNIPLCFSLHGLLLIFFFFSPTRETKSGQLKSIDLFWKIFRSSQKREAAEESVLVPGKEQKRSNMLGSEF